MPLLRVLAYIWASPNTLIGLLLGLLAFQPARTAEGILVFDSRVRGTTWALGKFRRAAITYGHVVLSNRRVEGSLLVHELHHVRQYERLGPFYIPLYVFIWLFTGYRSHPFERAAKLAEVEEG